MEQNATYAPPIADETTQNMTLGSYSVSFMRPFNTNDTEHDFQLTQTTIDVFWIYGRIEDGQMFIIRNENQSGAA